MNKNSNHPRSGSAVVLEKNGAALLKKGSRELESGALVLPGSKVEPFVQSQGMVLLKGTFIFIPGIGRITENNLKAQGILTWDDWKGKADIAGLSEAKVRVTENYLSRANQALHDLDATFFATHFPQREYWRLYGIFPDKTLFLDIETTGLSMYYDKITLIGTYDGQRIKTFVRGTNLNEIVQYIQNYKLVVTFNGKLFDIPFIKKEFPEVEIPPLHIDLRYLLRSLGIKGSLKKIEEKLGIKRATVVQEINGREAAVLWSRFVKGDDHALEKLLLYNTYDILNLQSLLHLCYKKKAEAVETKTSYNIHPLKSSKSFKVSESINFSTNDYFDIPTITTSTKNGLLEINFNGHKWLTINRDRIERNDVKISSLLRNIKRCGYTPISVGIDLSGSEGKASGICILQENKAYLELAKTDKEIIAKATNAKPTIISIDSPLSLPEGRCCADNSCECRVRGITRECERVLKKRGVNVYPCLIGSMQGLTLRGMKLARQFEDQGYRVIESFPGAAQDILGFPRKRVNLQELEIDLMNMGIKPFSNRSTITHDELDALTSALVGYFYLAGKYEALGNEAENFLIIPNLANMKRC